MTEGAGASRGDRAKPKSELAKWLLSSGWGWLKRDDEDAVVVRAYIKGRGAVRLVVTPHPEPGVPPALQRADRHALTVKRLTLADLDGQYPTPERAARILRKGRGGYDARVLIRISRANRRAVNRKVLRGAAVRVAGTSLVG